MAYTNHTIIVPAGATGVFTVPVVPGRRMQVGVANALADAVYDIVNYLYTAEKKPTRLIHASEKDISGHYAKSTVAGFVELGINVKVASAAAIEMEILECNLH